MLNKPYSHFAFFFSVCQFVGLHICMKPVRAVKTVINFHPPFASDLTDVL